MADQKIALVVNPGIGRDILYKGKRYSPGDPIAVTEKTADKLLARTIDTRGRTIPAWIPADG